MLQKGLNFSDMIAWLRDDFKREGYSILERYEEEPFLPVDLFCSKGKGKTLEFYFVICASINEISEEFQKKLFFYQYYLSLHYKPYQYKIVLAVPASAKVVKVPYYYAKEKEEKEQDFYKINGFGLWKIKDKNNIDKKTYEAKTLKDKIAEDFKSIIANEEEELTDKILPFVDRYIHDSVLGIAGAYPVKFKERYVDMKLIEEVFKIEKVSYRDSLFNAINKYLSEKGDEYDFVTVVFSKLWKDCIGIPYTDFLKTFDPVLQHVFKETNKGGRAYRDHYLHQFHVFLLGLCIIDQLYVKFTDKYENPEIIWLIISSFHDIAYPVQKYDEWSDDFFNEVFKIPHERAHIELRSNFVNNSFLCCTGDILARLCSVLLKEPVKGNWFSNKKSLMEFFYNEVTEAKNHCVLSSISLLKIIKEYENEIIKKMKINNPGTTFSKLLDGIFIPSALAIALHDVEVWRELKKMHGLHFLEFEDDPLTFLLIFCDNIQEWGRPSKSKSDHKGEKRIPLHSQTDDEGKKWKKFYLKEIEFDSQKSIFDIIIWTPNHTKTEGFFINKREELKEIQTFLKQPSNIKFTIHLKDKDGEGEDFSMEGPSSS